VAWRWLSETVDPGASDIVQLVDIEGVVPLAAASIDGHEVGL